MAKDRTEHTHTQFQLLVSDIRMDIFLFLFSFSFFHFCFSSPRCHSVVCSLALPRAIAYISSLFSRFFFLSSARICIRSISWVYSTFQMKAFSFGANRSDAILNRILPLELWFSLHLAFAIPRLFFYLARLWNMWRKKNKEGVSPML